MSVFKSEVDDLVVGALSMLAVSVLGVRDLLGAKKSSTLH